MGTKTKSFVWAWRMWYWWFSYFEMSEYVAIFFTLSKSTWSKSGCISLFRGLIFIFSFANKLCSLTISKCLTRFPFWLCHFQNCFNTTYICMLSCRCLPINAASHNLCYSMLKWNWVRIFINLFHRTSQARPETPPSCTDVMCETTKIKELKVTLTCLWMVQ